jgi:two-component system sensor histidine kinase/response regulator
MKRPSILVIDDEPNNFDVIETLLSNQDYLLHYANSGHDALAKLDSYTPDLILLDVMMPDMDGVEVCQRIKGIPRWQPIPIIMVTALTAKEDLARCLNSGADDFISKPINRLEMESRIHSMLRIKQQYDKLQAFTKLQRDTINMLGSSLEELRGSLTTAFPHELRNPLNGVLGSLDFLLSRFESMKPSDIRELLEVSYQSAQRLESLTQKFLDYLSLGQDNADLGFQVTGSLLIQSFAQDQAEGTDRMDDLECQLEVQDLAIAPNHLQWIIKELLDNAFKFSEPGTPIILQGQSLSRGYQLQISDRGRGMTQEQIARIGAFLQFGRNVYEQQGLGLGLAIAQKTVDMYGGRLQISSVYGQETVIDVTLPLARAAISSV